MMVVRTYALSAALAGLVTLTTSGPLLAHTTDRLEAAPTAPAANAKLEGGHGYVRELVIEDHVAGMTVRHLSMVPDTGAPVALIGKQVDQLVAGQSVTITGRRNGNLL